MEGSKIAWTENTFNPWMGCQRVSPGCEHCYAESLVTNRMQLSVWGPPRTTPRKRTSPAYWKKPEQWQRAALKEGTRPRVFCASLADVFEDHPAVTPWREELFALIEQCPALDWQLLTKRPENLRRFLPRPWLERPLSHVWLGTTVEDQRRADERIPHLLSTPAAVRFLSCEPLVERVNLSRVAPPGFPHDACDPLRRNSYRGGLESERIDWVIVGGESGTHSRPFDVSWARSIVKQCKDAGVPVFVKQLGAQPIDSDREEVLNAKGGVSFVRDRDHAEIFAARKIGLEVRPEHLRRFIKHKAGADPSEWPEDLRVQEFPRVSE